jgi:leucyl/phenylalanyl-tRNA--protein transferase
MPILLDDSQIYFPSADEADENGVIALGGDLSPERLLRAYYQGIFPWPHEGFPLLWFSPDPRFVLYVNNFRLNRNLAKLLKASSLDIRADNNFLAVMQGCQKAKRKDQAGTWISPGMLKGYKALFDLGFAHSIEAYRNEQLVGGLYGISIGSIFFGESMFYTEENASKICFSVLLAQLKLWQFLLIDCQAHSPHLEKVGAQFIKRKDFLRELEHSHAYPSKRGPWQLMLGPREAHEILVQI